MKKPRFSPWQIAVHILAWIPLLVLAVDALTGNLTVNPIQAAEQRTGDTALVLLIYSLACSPFFTVYRWPPVLKFRRPLGLYAFFNALLHFSIFLGLDYEFDFTLILADINQKAYIFVGLAAFIILVALAVTSFDVSKRLMRKAWTRLHRLVYLAGILVVLHFAWVSKGDFFNLTGDIGRPLIAGTAVIMLLVLRLPPVRKWLSRR
ncbi:MAG TPA: protein-methionine-sulfoxide reductase heme-binding subunit MsrQ [Anaerolinea sp.]|nr:protein-methionine-sulfoxide reductase heme-binding subunit MsrQ [Anaerolinea sp.]